MLTHKPLDCHHWRFGLPYQIDGADFIESVYVRKVQPLSPNDVGHIYRRLIEQVRLNRVDPDLARMYRDYLTLGTEDQMSIEPLGYGQPQLGNFIEL